MAFIKIYRFYFSVAVGALAFYAFGRRWWAWVLVALATRLLWAICESRYKAMVREKNFRKHAYAFKQFAGPYGIRLVNKAEKDSRTRQSLSEVFTGNQKELAKTVEQLETLDTLFQAGMRPQGDEYLLHDLKLKYGRHRLESEK